VPEIENLDDKALRKAFRRLKKDTRHFQTLLVRDPTDYVDFEVQLKQQLETLTHQLAAGTYVPQKPVLHPHPKSKGINRPTVVFDVRDALVYRFCIEQIEDELITATRRNPNIRGGVKIAPNANPAADGYYEKFFKDWTEHNEAIREGLAIRPIAACTDIASYFEGIDLQLLTDLVRSTVSGKAGVVTLLNFFLRSAKVQYDYGLSLSTGLPQEDIDCSRTLAYFYLHPHDDRLVSFTLEHDGELFRFADDITILVGTEAKARRSLKAVTDSLRELALVASIEKTEIMPSTVVAEELMYAENEALSELEDAAAAAAQAGDLAPEIAARAEAIYAAWSGGAESKKRSWRKVLKRFYTIATLLQVPFLLDDLERHLVDYPTEVQDKIARYLMRLQRQVDLGPVIERLLVYLESAENLYPSLETTILEALLYVDPELLPPEAQRRVGDYGRALVVGETGALSDYARALGTLLCFRFKRGAINEVADQYLRERAGTGMLRKYMAFVALTSSDARRRSRVLARARSEQDISLNRLMGLIDNPAAAKSAPVRRYLDRTKVYVWPDVVEEYRPVRGEVLSELIRIFAGPSQGSPAPQPA
jgi:hypothetical protein